MGRGWGESDGTNDVIMNKSLKTFSGECVPNLSIPQSKCAQVDVSLLFFFSVDVVNWLDLTLKSLRRQWPQDLHRSRVVPAILHLYDRGKFRSCSYVPFSPRSRLGRGIQLTNHPSHHLES